MFSKACEYGIRALIYICEQSENGRRVCVGEVAEAIDSPAAFTGKVLQSLAREGIVQSTKGPTGGYMISSDKQGSTNLLNIVKAIDGDNVYNGCGLGLDQCDAMQPCPMHDEFEKVRNDLKKMLTRTTIKDLTKNLSTGMSVVKR